MGWQSGVMGDHGARTQAREEAVLRTLSHSFLPDKVLAPLLGLFWV